MIRGYLAHVSFNMWEEAEPVLPADTPAWAREVVAMRAYRPGLNFDDALWQEMLDAFERHGINLVVLDLGDAVRYDSHPEIAVKGAWTTDRLRQELARLRARGIEPIPKLNFSTCHDAWLVPYARCVSSDAYYAVCRDLIAEVAALFDTPRFFHLGMDEENAHHQRYCQYVVVRQGELWWRDLYFLHEQVERQGSRAWVWSDYLWAHPEEFLRKMPGSVLQSNWYYGAPFNRRNPYVRAYLELAAHGYDQIPTGSNWSCEENFANTVRYCTRHIPQEHLLGFLQTPWHPTRPEYRRKLLRAAELLGDALGRETALLP